MQETELAESEARRKVALLQGFIKSSIADVGNKRKLNQNKATTVKVMILCMSAGATILLGLSFGPAVEATTKNIAFALSSSVTVLYALEPFFNYRALWIEHERANAGFYQVKDRLDFYVTGRSDTQLDLEEIRKFYDEYENVWSTLNQAWNQQRRLAEAHVDNNAANR